MSDSTDGPRFNVNPDANIELRTLDTTDGDARIAIVDDFLQNADELIDYAATHADTFAVPPKSYPGLTLRIEQMAADALRRYIRTHMAPLFGFMKGGIHLDTLLSMTTLQPQELSNLQRVCHSDPEPSAGRDNYASLLYLFRDPELGGTGFYRWRERSVMERATALEMQDTHAALEFLQEHYPSFQAPPAYIAGSNDVAELLDVVPARFNRWVFYSGRVPHSAHVTNPELLNNDFRRGRLTLNCFASVRPSP